MVGAYSMVVGSVYSYSTVIGSGFSLPSYFFSSKENEAQVKFVKVIIQTPKMNFQRCSHTLDETFEETYTMFKLFFHVYTCVCVCVLLNFSFAEATI